MLHDLFFRAILPDPVRILGVALRPFSLGHAIWFRRLGLPFLDGQPAGFRHLTLGIIICTCAFDEVQQLLDDPDYDKTQAKWMRRTKKASISEAHALFVDYIHKGTEIPPFEFEERGSVCAVPFEQTVRTFLHQRTNLSESEILNRPYSLCVWDYLTIKETDGRIQIYDKKDRAYLQRQADEFDVKWRTKNGSPS